MRTTLGMLAAVMALAGCNLEEIGDVACPTGGTKLTYENFGRAFFAGNCDSCHSAQTGDRQGAPAEFAFDTVAQVRQHKDRIFARSAGPNDSMPIGPNDPPREERDKLAEWLACGAP
jgi:uncharacterized membrane protein